MGAINKNTNDYECPRFADKSNKYKCPSCENDVIFRKGQIKQPHFAHYRPDNPCFYYDKPNETQVHKDAKLLMKSLLDGKKNIYMCRNCNNCEQRSRGYEENISYCITNDDYTENTKAVIEYKFNYNISNKRADVALIDNDTIKFIFEICHKNKTKEENRPEPWIEINAEDLINKINSGECVDKEGDIHIKCIRNYKCDSCIEYENKGLEMQKRRELWENQRKESHNKLRELEREREREIEAQKLRRELVREAQQIQVRKWDKIQIVQQDCKCVSHLCICENPKYELVKLSNNLFCVCCKKWKCRCIK